MHSIAVIGAGSWGTALAVLLASNGHTVKLWSNELQHVDDLIKNRENKQFLPDIVIPESIVITNSLEEVVTDVDGAVMAVPSHAMREVCNRLKGIIKENVTLISVAKGFESGTLLRMSQVLADVFPKNKIAVLSGPSHAEEVGKKMATAIVAAAMEHEVALWVQDLFSNDFFRVYTNNDVIGVEIGGAMKNIIAIGCGICYGRGCGDNTEAAILTRGLAEITRLGLAMGAKETTFFGLAGMGDLVVTCGSVHSRNRRAGVLLGKGESIENVLSSMGMVVEGVNACKNGYILAKQFNVEMPITKTIHNILTGEFNIDQAFVYLMNRDKTSENRHN